MGVLKTYSISNDINGSSCGSNKLHEEINNASCITNFDGLVIEGDNLKILGDSILDESALDSILLNHVDDDGNEPLINSLVDPGVLPKGFKSVNYKSELKDGIYLHPVVDILPTGLINKVTYYKDYIDSNNMGTEVLRVDFTWDVDMTESIPAARTVNERTLKTWTWKNNDGTDNSSTKTKPSKKYDDINKRKKEGQKRRENLLAMTQEGAVIGLIYTGSAASQVEAEELLIEFFEAISGDMTAYMESGKGSIYDDVTNDTIRTWLDSDLSTAIIGSPAVPAYLAMGLDGSWASKTLRDYIIDKLKGLV